MLENKHKDHVMTKIDAIYEDHIEKLKIEIKLTENKYDNLNCFLKNIEEKINYIRTAKQERSNELEELFEMLKSKLDAIMRAKLLKLLNIKSNITEKRDAIEGIKKAFEKY